MPVVEVKRDPSPLAPAAARLARAVLPILPAGIRPDHVTLAGLAAQLGGAAGLYLAGADRRWFLLGVGGLLLHWLLDALDGELANARGLRSERGFFLDLYLDAVGLAVVVLAIGASGYATLGLWAPYAALILLRGQLVLHEIMLARRFIIPFPSQGEAPFVVAALALLTTLADRTLLTIGGWGLGWFDAAGLLFAVGLALEMLLGAVALYRRLGQAG